MDRQNLKRERSYCIDTTYSSCTGVQLTPAIITLVWLAA